MYKFIVLAALVAVANAGFLSAPAAVGYAASPYAAVSTPAITSQHSNILRSYGNLGQVSTYSKTIDTPYSSVRKSDVRVSNDALAYHAPAVAAYHAPVAAAYAAPAYAAPAVAAYHAAPAVAAYHGAYAPAYGAAAYAAPAVAGHGLLGVAYSAAPAVAHISYSNAYGINYAY
ncbi:cuticle protein 67-like [Periplaneta americana]|uniref:cuticle protein 67-like n=1 Tax=Periplaneta americana TaxID=6978 RepID=UPI0037E70EDB